jgi:hypothetical protein
MFKRSYKKLNEKSPEKCKGKNSALEKNINSTKNTNEKIVITGNNTQ